MVFQALSREFFDRGRNQNYSYETVESDPGHCRLIRLEEPWWDPHPPALWCPLKRPPSQSEIDDARRRAIMDGRAADTRGEWDEY
jgi:hypothetical protein